MHETILNGIFDCWKLKFGISPWLLLIYSEKVLWYQYKESYSENLDDTRNKMTALTHVMIKK
jgi:hypothetical protein